MTETLITGDFYIEVVRDGPIVDWVIYDQEYADRRFLSRSGSSPYRSRDGLVFPGIKSGSVLGFKWMALWFAKRACKKHLAPNQGVERYRYQLERDRVGDGF